MSLISSNTCTPQACRWSCHTAERKHGLCSEQIPVSAYVWSSKNLKDLKELKDMSLFAGNRERGYLACENPPPTHES